MTTYPTIALLDEVVSNQIAAGEVVERPASVVKELVENALDAGARRIRIALEQGGRTLIEVVDDGLGMDGASARLAFARHATSKLRAAEDLAAIATYGFRGEALASILSVSKVSVTSRRADMAEGVRLQGEAGKLGPEEPAGCPVGTAMQVAELFFNVPARLKFLRTPATELGQILRFVDALALARPDLHLGVVHNGRKVCDYPPDPDLARRAHAVLGADVAQRLHPVVDELEYAVHGMLSDPGLHHAGPGQLVTLVDGRAVSDRTLQHAVQAAYGTLLERGRYPIGVLSLRCPPGAVDVNVHPAKTEVRFVSSQAVHAAVTRAIRAMLSGTPWVKHGLEESDSQSFFEPIAVPEPRPGAARPGANSASWSPPDRGFAPSTSLAAPWSTPRAAAPARLHVPTAAPRPEAASLDLDAQVATYGGLRYVGQVGKCFLVCESADALVLIDQHAAHERVLFERLVKGLRDQGHPSQQLLVPVLVPLAPAEVAAVVDASAELGRLGFDLQASGERMVRVLAQPAALPMRSVEQEVRALAASLVEGGRGKSTVERLERSAATLACHAAVRAGDAMTHQAVVDLLREMDGVDLSAYCPHGRPCLLRARLDEVARWFHRS